MSHDEEPEPCEICREPMTVEVTMGRTQRGEFAVWPPLVTETGAKGHGECLIGAGYVDWSKPSPASLDTKMRCELELKARTGDNHPEPSPYDKTEVRPSGPVEVVDTGTPGGGDGANPDVPELLERPPGYKKR